MGAPMGNDNAAKNHKSGSKGKTNKKKSGGTIHNQALFNEFKKRSFSRSSTPAILIKNPPLKIKSSKKRKK